MGHWHHHGHGEPSWPGERFGRRWERGPEWFRGYGPPPWMFRRGPGRAWFDPGESFEATSREERIAVLELHQRRLEHRLARVAEEIRRLKTAGGKGEPGSTF